MKLKLILEFDEFNLLRFNSDNTDVSIGLAPNNSLSVNAFDRHEDAIRAGMSRLNNIMNSLANSSNFKSLKSKLTIEEQKPSALKILRIIPNNNDYYVYISFIIKENEYDGVIINALQNPKLKSNVFIDQDLIQTKEWKIRLSGLIIDSFKQFLNIESGDYSVLKDNISCVNIHTGEMLTLKKNYKITVIKTITSENKILIQFKDRIYSLTKDNYIYFNYWFLKL